MSVKVNKTAIGAFVLGAIVLFVAVVLVLGAGKFFTTEHSYITCYDGSVKGLNVGSPVMFRGVKVGMVTDVSIIADPVSRQMKIPVIFTLEPGKFKGIREEFQRDPNSIRKAVLEKGLRTQLQTLSFVTGQLTVSLDFFPDKPPIFVGLSSEYPEIPSVPTSLEQLQKSLESLPYKEIVDNFNSTIAGINKLVNSIDAKKTTQNIESALQDVQKLVQHLDARIDPLAASLLKTSATTDAAFAETRETMVNFRSDVKKVVGTADKTLQTASSALEAARSTLQQSEQTLQAYGDESRLLTELNKTLRELAATSRSLRNLSDQLERHPESFIRGKFGVKGD